MVEEIKGEAESGPDRVRSGAREVLPFRAGDEAIEGETAGGNGPEDEIRLRWPLVIDSRASRSREGDKGGG